MYWVSHEFWRYWVNHDSCGVENGWVVLYVWHILGEPKLMWHVAWGMTHVGWKMDTSSRRAEIVPIWSLPHCNKFSFSTQTQCSFATETSYYFCAKEPYVCRVIFLHNSVSLYKESKPTHTHTIFVSRHTHTRTHREDELAPWCHDLSVHSIRYGSFHSTQGSFSQH